MTLGAPRRLITGAGLLLLSLMIAGCNGNGGNGTGPSANAPVLSNFEVRPLTAERANTAVRYQITATATDPDNDLIGGQVELTDAVKTLTLAIDSSVLRGSTIGVVLVTNPVPAGQYTLSFAVVDAAGNRSNVITFTVNISLVPKGAVELPRRTDSEGVIQWLESTR